MISCTHTHTGRYLRLAGRRGGCCTVAPGRAWRRRRSLGCAFCPPSDTVPPSFAGPFRRSASTARAKRQQPDFEPKPHEICIVVKRTYSVSLFVRGCRRPTHRAPLCGEPLRPTLVHLARLDGGGLVQMCTLAGRSHAEIVAVLLNANDVAPLGAISTRHIALHSKRKHGISAFVSLCSWM